MSPPAPARSSPSPASTLATDPPSAGLAQPLHHLRGAHEQLQQLDYATACLLKMLRMVTLSGILVLASMATDLLSTSATNCTRSAAVGGGGGGGREGVGGEEEEAEAEAEARGVVEVGGCQR